ncbi:hypothetical protein [Erwinia sp. 9145]|uniref:hypothetical protein n=1 Tax=Erwinia sp. 9145 TaxID=1500895 RepID=UPI00055302D1|nr:hypothetical protein [Erwinia sp. 9145]
MRLPTFLTSVRHQAETEQPAPTETTPLPPGNVKTLSTEAEQKLRARNEHPPSSSHNPPQQKQGKRNALKGGLSARPFTVSAGLTGTERTVDRALRDAAPEQNIVEEEDADHPLLQRSKQLLRVARSSVQTLEENKTSLWQRPAPDKHRQRLVRLFPFLKPQALRDVAAIHGGKRSGEEKIDAAVPREEIARTVQHLQETLTEQRLKLETATEVLERQYQARAAARPQSGNAHTAQLQEQIRLAEAQVQHHQDILLKSLEDPTVLALSRLSDFADNADLQSDFAAKRLRELADAAVDIRTQSHTSLTATDLKLAANTAKIKQLMILANSMEAGYRQLHNALVSLEKLNEQNPPPEDELVCRHLLLKQAAESLLLDNMHQLESLEIDSTSAGSSIKKALELLNKEQGELMQQRTSASRVWVNASKTEGVLAGKTPAPPTASPAPQPDKTALSGIRQEIQASFNDVVKPLQDAELSAQLDKLTRRLNEDASLTKQPSWLIANIVKSTLGAVCADKPERAGKVLQQLSTHTAQHWTTLAAPHDETTRDLIQFCHRLSELPRGADLLQLLSASGDQPPDGELSKALRTFWNADAAQQAEKDPAVKAWLQGAQNVAKSKLAKDGAAFDDVAHAAYNAVRNGYYSNAPGSAYDQDNKRLLKATNEWVFRAMARPPAGQAAELRPIPNVRKNPFNAKTRDRAMDITDGMNMFSLRSKGETLIDGQLARIKNLTERCRAEAGDDASAQALAEHAEHFTQLLLKWRDKGQHLSQQPLTGRHMADLRRMQANNGNRLTARFSRADLPEALSSLFTQHLSVYEALNQLGEHLNNALPAEKRETPAAPSAEEQDALRLLKTRHFTNKEDVLTFFKPLIEGSRLRDRVKLGEGGTLGGGLPALPLNALFPVVPTFSFELSRSDEAYVQLFMPILGMEMSFGKTTTKAGEASVGLTAGGSVAPHVSLLGGVKGTLRKQEADSDATLIRFFRRRFHDDEMRQKMYTALESMVRWDSLPSNQGPAFSGPLEAILARSDDVSLSHVSSSSQTTAFRGAVFGRLPFASLATSATTGAWINNEMSLSAQHERNTDTRQEAQGTVRINGYQADTTTQTTRLDGTVSASPLSNQPGTLGNATTGRFSAPFQAGVGRDLSWHQERNELSLYTIEDKQDADLDRHYSTVADMQKEISVNRDAWLMRCIETLELDAEKRDTPELREQAAGLLDDFEQQLTQLSQQTHYALFNVNYSLKGETGAEIDGYRSLAHLFRQRGDETKAREMDGAVDKLLQTRESWRPLMLIVRERAKDSSRLGLRSALRIQRNRNNDGLRTAMQFPPP